ncbi:DUF4857 domain-containing protein [Desulfosarcina sp. OttesenSCG-928-A07]|nr:DUF4857 domain-containing protein [Desulfosarcina sp. OttesenSCG-928-G17]MDL2328648.1 DUF4857 domain-containing protein [Desulfosarcina sp. OttesenSCG-928-A07]
MHWRAIFRKEWIKLRWAVLGLVIFAVGLGAFFWFRLDLAFKSVEPESMMWYRFAQLEDKPYASCIWFAVFSGVILALVQFLPEAIRNRVRILTHLPVPLPGLVARHLCIGSFFLALVCGLLGSLIVFSVSRMYPAEVVQVAVKDVLFWLIPAFGMYLGLSGAIIEQKDGKRVVRLLGAVVFSVLFVKERYESVDLVGVVALLWLAWGVYDGFLSVKTKTLTNPVYLSGYLLLALLIGVMGTHAWKRQFPQAEEKFYIFYSPLLSTFVYQKNGIGHQFEYGTQSVRFDKAAYEAALPFVFWKNLDIQGKLPIVIEDEVFDKDRIQSSRLSLQYDFDMIRSPEVQLYPFFNPQSHVGVIPFPEESLVVKKDHMRVYDCDTADINLPLTQEVNQVLQNAGLSFPIQDIWGKTTNMKPYDWGYFIKDQKGALFNLRRQNDAVTATRLPLPGDVKDVVFMRISENKQQNFYGYAITDDSRVFLVAYPDYTFIPLKLHDFNYKTVRFQLLSDPLHYLVRYDNDHWYRATLFDKTYHFLLESEFR